LDFATTWVIHYYSSAPKVECPLLVEKVMVPAGVFGAFPDDRFKKWVPVTE